MKTVTKAEEKSIRKGKCPDCGKKGFLGGPGASGAQNFKCANPDCGSRFNDLSPFGIDRISDPSPDRKRVLAWEQPPGDGR
jgi:transposase-like protein